MAVEQETYPGLWINIEPTAEANLPDSYCGMVRDIEDGVRQCDPTNELSLWVAPGDIEAYQSVEDAFELGYLVVTELDKNDQLRLERDPVEFTYTNWPEQKPFFEQLLRTWRMGREETRINGLAIAWEEKAKLVAMGELGIEVE